MTSVQEVNPRVLGIREPTNLQSLSAHITGEIKRGQKKPFKKVIDVSSADPQRAGTAPNSFLRQVLAVCLYPDLLKEKSCPLDVRERAQVLLRACAGGSVGSYSTNCCGLPLIQKSVAEFITRRDGGVKSYPEDIIFSCGSQKNLSMVFHLMSSGEGRTQTAVLTLIPCPHTVPPLMDGCGVKLVPCQLKEEQGWALNVDKLQHVLKVARGHCEPRAIYISNPGIPAGYVQDRKTIEEVIRFAAAEGLVLLVEELYQDSVFGLDKEFISFKKVLFEMGEPYSETVELVSFSSISNACIGECGLRGGYMEVINFDPAVKKYLQGMQATGSPPVLPQFALEIMVNPPKPGDLSYQIYTQEISLIKSTLSQNSQRASELLNNLPGMTCQPAMAGVFLYPRLILSSKMIEESKMMGMEPDALYCQMLLEEEGLCLGAGCENGQHDQNYYIRLCVLAPPDVLDEVLARLRSFHLRLLSRFP